MTLSVVHQMAIFFRAIRSCSFPNSTTGPGRVHLTMACVKRRRKRKLYRQSRGILVLWGPATLGFVQSEPQCQGWFSVGDVCFVWGIHSRGNFMACFDQYPDVVEHIRVLVWHLFHWELRPLGGGIDEEYLDGCWPALQNHQEIGMEISKLFVSFAAIPIHCVGWRWTISRNRNWFDGKKNKMYKYCLPNISC